ncbi:hypothetical protein RB195_010689 [Necator americanus]|uniref:Uncharacterized protein n=1 Tax=Necator americanus TaxID=51031 RepID=A0ABR1CZ11_NECAM
MTALRNPKGTAIAPRREMEKITYDFYSDLFDSHAHLPPQHLREDGDVILEVFPSEIRHAIMSTLLNRQAPSVPELEHVDRPTYAVKEEPPTMSGVFDLYPEDERWEICGDDVISAEMLKYLPPSGIREMTEIISLIWIDKKIPDSWRHAIIIPLHKKLPVTDSRNYRGIGY